MFASRASATSSSTWRHAARVVSDDVGALAAQFGFKLRAGEHATPRAVASRVRAPDAALDARVTLIYAIIMFAFNWLLRRAVVEPLAGRLMGYGARGVGGARKARRRKMEKFAQSALEMATYGTFTIIGCAIVPGQRWFWPSSEWWIGAPVKTRATESALRAYYLAYGARYVAGAANVFLEHKRKDFWEMQLHHFATIGVIWVSYIVGWTRVGAVIMLVLDPADVPLHAAKCAKYVGDARGDKKYQLAADVLFGIFLVIFFVMRLVMYPYVVYSVHFEARRYFSPSIPYWVCVALLYVILGLQVYWFKLIVNVEHKVLATGNAEDVRSDDEDEPNGAKAHHD